MNTAKLATLSYEVATSAKRDAVKAGSFAAYLAAERAARASFAAMLEMQS